MPNQAPAETREEPATPEGTRPASRLSVLRMIAGFELPTTGTIQLDGRYREIVAEPHPELAAPAARPRPG